MVCDEASGLIITSKKNAEKKGFKKAVFLIGYGERTSYEFNENIVDVTNTGHLPAGVRAFRQLVWPRRTSTRSIPMTTSSSR